MVRADLHLHTALSPCAADEMTPDAIVATALDRGLDMIAVCDHNSARNVSAVQEAAGARLAVIAGIEITTAEEVHVVGLLPSATAASLVSDRIGATLPEAGSDYNRYFGEQYVLASDGTVVAGEDKALATATGLRLENAVALIQQHGGVAVAAHIDRPHFGVLGQLGFFPYDAGFDAVELSRHVVPGSGEARGYREHRLPIVFSSDAHFLEDVGAASTRLELQAPSFAELRLALKGSDGRTVLDA